ncbi:MAG: hypothetical protein DRQ64_01590 [Gammaproteobacteria bacterium]|nr:MAG: hypothetical protein DRQ64_01590 [Gammaproteobacteria bacterium]
MDIQDIGGAVNRGVQQGATSVAGAISADQNVASNNTSSRDSQVTLSTTSPGDAQRILNQQLQSALSKVQETPNPSRLNTLDTNSGSPSQVAGQTLSTIQRGLADISDTAGSVEQVEFLNEAAQGVSEGFAETRDILSNISARVDEVRANIDATEELVQRGVESIRDDLAADSKPANGTPADKLVS